MQVLDELGIAMLAPLLSSFKIYVTGWGMKFVLSSPHVSSLKTDCSDAIGLFAGYEDCIVASDPAIPNLAIEEAFVQSTAEHGMRCFP